MSTSAADTSPRSLWKTIRCSHLFLQKKIYIYIYRTAPGTSKPWSAQLSRDTVHLETAQCETCERLFADITCETHTLLFTDMSKYDISHILKPCRVTRTWLAQRFQRKLAAFVCSSASQNAPQYLCLCPSSCRPWTGSESVTKRVNFRWTYLQRGSETKQVLHQAINKTQYDILAQNWDAQNIMTTCQEAKRWVLKYRPELRPGMSRASGCALWENSHPLWQTIAGASLPFCLHLWFGFSGEKQRNGRGETTANDQECFCTWQNNVLK